SIFFSSPLPFFRYEHPQAGRFRQFHQFGFEVIGDKNPAIDAQVVQIFYNILKELKFKKIMVEVNSIGDSQCRPYYKKLLVSYLKYRMDSLCVNCRKRVKENPLAVLDCKEEKCQRIRSQAPQIIDHLCDECHRHFREFLEFLDELDLPYNLNPYLVRGLDYYTKTVFEIFEEGDSQKKALVGGGRYDNLCKILGGEPTPACGGAAGIERIVEILRERAPKTPYIQSQRIFLAQLGALAKRRSLKLFEEFRKNKVQVAESLGRDSLKAQLKAADRMEAQYTIILGQKEVLEGTAIIRDMKTGKQDTVKLEKMVKEMKKRLKK
ncbi:histidine--tRNA ligase, partial [Patescibacteria group bacterium]